METNHISIASTLIISYIEYFFKSNYYEHQQISAPVNDDMVKFEIEQNLKERLVYLKVRKIMLNQLFSSNPKDLYSIIGDVKKKEVKNEPKGEIIMLNPQGKK